MSSSPLAIVELYDASRFADNDAINAQEWRDGPANNALHWADQRGQVLVNFAAITSSADAGDTELIPPDPVDTSTWTRIGIFGPLSLSLKADGTPYRLLCAFAGYSDVGNSVDFRITVSDFGSIDSFVYDPPTSGTETFSGITATSTAYLTPDSGNKWIDVSIETADAATGLRGTYTDVSGTPRSVRTCEVWAVIWGKTSNLASKPIATNLWLQEYFPP